MYHINRKDGRNPLVTEFIRWIDKARVSGVDSSVWKKVKSQASGRITGRRGGGQYQERLRIYPEVPSPSKLPTQPSKVAIDYFDVNYWNELPANIRAEFDHKIALPLFPPNTNPNWPNLPHVSKTMQDDEFMQAYGNNTLSNYNLPTAEEIAQMLEYDGVQREEMEEEQEYQRLRKEQTEQRDSRRRKRMASHAKSTTSPSTSRRAAR